MKVSSNAQVHVTTQPPPSSQSPTQARPEGGQPKRAVAIAQDLPDSLMSHLAKQIRTRSQDPLPNLQAEANDLTAKYPETAQEITRLAHQVVVLSQGTADNVGRRASLLEESMVSSQAVASSQAAVMGEAALSEASVPSSGAVVQALQTIADAIMQMAQRIAGQGGEYPHIRSEIAKMYQDLQAMGGSNES